MLEVKVVIGDELSTAFRPSQNSRFDIRIVFGLSLRGLKYMAEEAIQGGRMERWVLGIGKKPAAKRDLTAPFRERGSHTASSASLVEHLMLAGTWPIPR